jgi:cytochrome c oxidase subunit 3
MRNPFHLVTLSPWPLLMSLNLLFFLVSFVSIFNGSLGAYLSFFTSLISVLSILFFWMNDIIIESQTGCHTNLHSRTLISAFIWFCLTEVMIFFSLFWAYFHNAWNPLYVIWPPVGIEVINPYSIPLLNTALLFWAGLAATAAHHYFINGDRKNTLIYLGTTIFLTVIFFICQFFEFYTCSFDISDSIFGTTFFMLTGLHGLHIFMAIVALSILFGRILSYHLSDVYLNSVLLYFHLLDAVWILLVLLIYIN